MQKLNYSQKQLCSGGFAVKKVRKINSTNKTGKFKFLKDKQTWQKINTYSHNAALMAMSVIPDTMTLINNIKSLNNFNDKYENKQNYGTVNSSFSKNPKFSETIRPTIRFSPYYHRSSISYGMPWYY